MWPLLELLVLVHNANALNPNSNHRTTKRSSLTGMKEESPLVALFDRRFSRWGLNLSTSFQAKAAKAALLDSDGWNRLPFFMFDNNSNLHLPMHWCSRGRWSVRFGFSHVNAFFDDSWFEQSFDLRRKQIRKILHQPCKLRIYLGRTSICQKFPGVLLEHSVRYKWRKCGKYHRLPYRFSHTPKQRVISCFWNL